MSPSTPAWRPASEHPSLSAADVHVWRASLVQPRERLAALAEVLSSQERERLERFRLSELGTRFVVTRAALRIILGRYLGIDAREVVFGFGPHGKPFLGQSPPGPKLEFNLTHSRELVLFAVVLGRRVGIDLEFLRPIPEAERIARRWLTEGESAALLSLPAPARAGAFQRCWTRKEAFAKARGEGLALLFRRFEVSVEASGVPRLLHVDGDPLEAQRWSLVDLPAPPGYLASLAVEGARPTLSFWTWE